ncbi:MAG: alcohol dehydrogenase catalytic domain-containing protein [Desulfobacterales bacterium]
MYALQLEKIGLLKEKEIPIPKPGPGEVLLRVMHCAVCRTDAKMWKQGQRDLVLPRVLGHEICGILPESGKRFAVWPGNSCGCCAFCQSGQENLCLHMQILGFHKDGGFAEYAAVQEKSLIPVPDGLPSELACLAEPLGCTLNAMEQSGVKENQKVLIYGAGPVGLMAGISARYLGAVPFVMEIRPERTALSKAFREQIGMDVCGNEMKFDIAVNAAPSTDTFAHGLSRLRAGGSFCLFSGLTDGKEISSVQLNEIHYRQLQICGAYGCTKKQMETALNILTEYGREAALLTEKQIDLHQVPEILPRILAGQAMKHVIRISRQS